MYTFYPTPSKNKKINNIKIINYSDPHHKKKKKKKIGHYK